MLGSSFLPSPTNTSLCPRSTTCTSGGVLSKHEWRGPFPCPSRLLDCEGGAGSWVTPHPLCLSPGCCRTAGKKMDRSQHSGALCDLDQPLPLLFFIPFLLLPPKYNGGNHALETIKFRAQAGNRTANRRTCSSEQWFSYPSVPRKNADSRPHPQRGNEDSFCLRWGLGSCTFTLLTRHAATHPH